MFTDFFLFRILPAFVSYIAGEYFKIKQTNVLLPTFTCNSQFSILGAVKSAPLDPTLLRYTLLRHIISIKLVCAIMLDISGFSFTVLPFPMDLVPLTPQIKIDLSDNS